MNKFLIFIASVFICTSAYAASNIIPRPPKRPAEFSKQQKWMPPKEIQDKVAPAK